MNVDKNTGKQLVYVLLIDVWGMCHEQTFFNDSCVTEKQETVI